MINPISIQPFLALYLLDNTSHADGVDIIILLLANICVSLFN